MNQRLPKFFFPAAISACCLFAIYFAASRPGYFNNYQNLAALCFLQVLLAAIWNYRAGFLPLLLAIFLWAGMALPLNVAWTSGRWLVLGAGALVGLFIYGGDHRCRFGSFHLAGLFCVVAALVSAAVSAYPNMAILKASSLLLLFLYAATGARLAVLGREAEFFSQLLVGCELVAYITALTYFAFKLPIFGNPNSLGAVMGVAVVPILLWGTIASSRTWVRRRRTFALLVALLLLFSSYARAGIVAAVISSVLLCVALRQYGLLLRGAIVALLLAVFVMTTIPLHEQPSGSMTAVFVYKGRQQDGLLGSRRPAWDETVSAIQEHPWFGSGFGTSQTTSEVVQQAGGFESVRQATREHGNSYLALTEWVGLLGDVPFLALLLLIAANVVRAVKQMHRTGNVFSYGVPLAGVMAAGLVHAGFEDWLFAPGYYLCVFFWALAFIMVDVVPAAAPSVFPSPQIAPPVWASHFGGAPITQ
jgi:O-antigen ligase